MVAHVPIHPQRAAEILEQAQIGDPYVVLANACEGGIMKGYAASTRIIYSNGRDEVVRHRRIPPTDWRRIISEGKVADVATATVRLSGSTDFDGGPKVTMIDIGFDEKGIRDYAARHGGRRTDPADEQPLIVSSVAKPTQSAPSTRQATTPALKATAAQVAELPLFDVPAVVVRTVKTVPEVAPGALVMTIAQACVALSVSRTTLYALHHRGDLTILRGKGGSRLSVEDVNRLLSKRAERG